MTNSVGEPLIRRVMCVYDQKPWLNLDAAGDSDFEGVWFRVFLYTSGREALLAQGTFHIEMYRFTVDADGQKTRTLASDWHYPVDRVHTIAKPGMLGEGYVLRLRWARKDLSGSEVEFVTRFEDPDGNVARSGTKRFRIPKHGI